MMRNLKAEMLRRGVSNLDIQTVLKKTDKTVRDKINGAAVFTLPEALLIRDTFFPGFSLDYLFASSIARSNTSRQTDRV